METLNIAVISGNISQPARVVDVSGSGECCLFSVVTYKMTKTGDTKVRFREEIPVAMYRPGTIAKYLTKGKPVVVQGRIAPDTEGVSNLIASSVTFPGSKSNDE